MISALVKGEERRRVERRKEGKKRRGGKQEGKRVRYAKARENRCNDSLVFIEVETEERLDVLGDMRAVEEQAQHLHRVRRVIIHH